MDAGASEVNILNRLHFLVSDARERAARDKEVMTEIKELRRFVIPSMLPRKLDDLNSYATLEVEKWRAWVSGLELWEKTQSIKRKIGW
jgi:signal transduction histidine kinase